MPRQASCDCGGCKKCKHRIYMRDYYWRNRDIVCETARRTRQRHLETFRARDRARGFRPSAPAKMHARNVLNHEVKMGRLTREPCEVCGAEKVDAHHDDYGKPLEVRWLCRLHHGIEHRREVAV